MKESFKRIYTYVGIYVRMCSVCMQVLYLGICTCVRMSMKYIRMLYIHVPTIGTYSWPFILQVIQMALL